jgi:hypothetical protein
MKTLLQGEMEMRNGLTLYSKSGGYGGAHGES